MLYIALHLFQYLVTSIEITSVNKLYACLIPQVAVFLMVPSLGAFESVGIGLNLDNSSVVYKKFVFNQGILMLVLDFLIYTIIGIYLDNVMPRESG